MAEVADAAARRARQGRLGEEGDAGRRSASRTSRAPGAALLGNLRQVDALLVVLDGFSPGADPAGDLENLKLELLVADRDHVAGRLERVEKQAKSGDPKLRAEVERLREVLAAVDAGSPLADVDGELPDGLEPLTTKPLIAVENGPGGIDLALEAELAELPTRRRPRSATARRRRSTRSSGACATRST